MMHRLAVAVLFLAVSSTTAGADCIPIAAVPYTVAAPGVYCLAADMSYPAESGAAITIAADDVTVDLRGYHLAGVATPTTSALGIHAIGHSHVTVTNGGIRGFQVGVRLDGPVYDALLSHLRVLSSTLHGLYIGPGAANELSHCSVSYIGGTAWATAFTAGIVVDHAVTVTDNDVRAPYGGTAYGIVTGGFGVLARNRVFGTYSTTACYRMGTEDVYRDNTARGCSTSYVGGIDGGDNF